MKIINPNKFIKLKQNDLTIMKNKAVDGGCFCPILGAWLTKENVVIDHKHISKKEIKEGKTGIDGKGLLRGIIHDQANVFIGKIEKGFLRSGCHKLESGNISEFLRNIADYLESPPMEQIYIHPSERPKKKTLTQMEYKRICKYWFKMFPKKRTLPKYPKGKKRNLTKKWQMWLNMANELNAPVSKREIKRIKL